MVAEIAHVKPEAAVILYVNNIPQLFIILIGFFIHIAVSTQPHHLIFRVVHAEAEICSYGRVKKPNGVRESYLPVKLNLIAPAFSVSCRGPFANAISRDYSGFLKRADKELGGCVRK